MRPFLIATSVLFLLPTVSYSNTFDDIRAKAGASKETFWLNNKAPAYRASKVTTLEPWNYLDIAKGNTATGTEGFFCIECTKTPTEAVAEYIYNMYLRIATTSSSNTKIKDLELCTYDAAKNISYFDDIDINLVGVLDPLFTNLKVVAFLMNNSTPLTTWYADASYFAAGLKVVGNRLKTIGVEYAFKERNPNCEKMFLNMLEKSMNNVKFSSYTLKMEPRYAYSTSFYNNTTLPADIQAAVTNAIAGAQTDLAGEYKNICYQHTTSTDVSGTEGNIFDDGMDGPAAMTKHIDMGTPGKKITTTTYTYRPTLGECRYLSYVYAKNIVESTSTAITGNLKDLYEIWVLPSIIAPTTHLKFNSSAVTYKWDYHVAVLAVFSKGGKNYYTVVDGLLYNTPKTMSDWMAFFDPSTKFMVREFAKSTPLRERFCTDAQVESMQATKHPVEQ